jgi:hypothetical protein
VSKGFRRFLAPRTLSQQRKLEAYREASKAKAGGSFHGDTYPSPYADVEQRKFCWVPLHGRIAGREYAEAQVCCCEVS